MESNTTREAWPDTCTVVCMYLHVYIRVRICCSHVSALSSVSQEIRHLCKRECAVLTQSQQKYKSPNDLCNLLEHCLAQGQEPRSWGPNDSNSVRWDRFGLAGKLLKTRFATTLPNALNYISNDCGFGSLYKWIAPDDSPPPMLQFRERSASSSEA